MAAERFSFAIPAGALNHALIVAGDQGRANIGFSDPRLNRLTTPGLSGTMTTARALERLLAGSGFAATELRTRTFRIDPKQPARIVPVHRSPAQPPAADELQDIVVTSSKRGIGLTRLAGSAIVVSLDDRTSPLAQTDGLGDLARRLPIVQTTALGPGRDKLFLRGIADSSFPGPTQSTIGSYFGDTRLLYNGPDPNLRLYDVDRVELLIGPQGTLYGAGAIGGIVRISPNHPQLDTLSASVQGSVALVEHGGVSHDLGAMANVPVVDDMLAVRAVGYQTYEAGYIDDIRRKKSDINGVFVSGGRLAIRARPGPQWTVDIGGIGQYTHARDLQYAARGAGDYARSSSVAQPYNDKFYTGYGTITRDGEGGVNALLTVGITDRRNRGQYDATIAPTPGPIAYDQSGHDRLYTTEVRIWRSLPSGFNWLLGASALLNHDAENRSLGPIADPRDLVGVDNRTKDIAAFGEATVPLPLHFSVTIGGRVNHGRTDGRPLDVPGPATFYRGMSSTRFDPSFGFVGQITPWLNWFGRYGVGFRTGGLAVAARVGRTATYEADRIKVFESGVRFGHADRLGLSGHASLSYARWSNIQADLVANNGFPFTANVGNGRITGFEAMADWRPTPALQIGGAVFINHSKLIDPAPAFVRAEGDPLPDTPRYSGNARLIWRPLGDPASGPQIELSSRYVGRSRLGVGTRLSLPQGRYAQFDAGVSMPLRFAIVSLRVDNLTDHRGNRFAVGNPLLLGREQQFTPLRPRTFRLGFSTRIGKQDGHIVVDPQR